MSFNSAEKKQKLDEDAETFPSIGQQAEAVDGSSQLRDTGIRDAAGRPVQEVESLCMNCHQQGTTRLLFTMIPEFREVVIMSFECPHCGFKSNEVQTAAEIQEKGQRIIFKVECTEDMSRQVVKTEYATCRFEELDIEIPPGSSSVTTIEGLLSGMIDDLRPDQPVRKHMAPEQYEKLEVVLSRVDDVLAGGQFPITFTLDDPSGNSFVGHTPDDRHEKWDEQHYFRTPAQSRAIGLNVPQEQVNRAESMADVVNSGEFDENVPEQMRDEVQSFEAVCPACHKSPCPTHMKMVNIPHFKDVIIISTVCPFCGYKSNDVKTGGAIPERGRRITLKVTDPEDLTRDILKSETCSIKFPELELDLEPGTLGGRFTTIEGLLQQVHDELDEKVLQKQSDSIDSEAKQRWIAFLDRLQLAINGKEPFTLQMEDPLAASYVQNVYAPEPDPNMIVQDYDRTPEQDEELGLKDMKVD